MGEIEALGGKRDRSRPSGLRSVDVTGKDDVRREAVAQGRIRLSKRTLAAIRKGTAEKGDVLGVASVAATLAAKRTPDLVPGCHMIPLTHIEVDFDLEGEGITATCRVTSVSKTGVEMEALTGVSVALLTIWDMTKELEKDASGKYPNTKIEDIRVITKVKVP